MKKSIKILFFLCFTTFFVGCSNNTTEKDVKPDEIPNQNGSCAIKSINEGAPNERLFEYTNGKLTKIIGKQDFFGIDFYTVEYNTSGKISRINDYGYGNGVNNQLFAYKTFTYDLTGSIIYYQYVEKKSSGAFEEGEFGRLEFDAPNGKLLKHYEFYRESKGAPMDYDRESD